MKITNRHSLPEPLVHAVSHDRYDPGDGDISATTLIAPARQRLLKELHKDETEEDAVDRIWALVGSAVHYILENAVIHMKESGEWDDSRHIAEQRFYAEVGGKRVSAQIDLKEDKRLIDFKVTSVWAIKDAIYGDGKKEWTAQLNIQRYLLAKNGIEVDELFIMAIARDWNMAGKLNDENYPPRGCMIEIPVWSLEKTEGYIQERLNAHYSGYLPMCTPEEMWEQPARYALMKKGRKAALRLGDSVDFLMEYAKDKGLVEYADVEQDFKTPDGDTFKALVPKNRLIKGHSIEKRPGKRTRCERYCEVAPFCDQYQEWQRIDKG